MATSPSPRRAQRDPVLAKLFRQCGQTYEEGLELLLKALQESLTPAKPTRNLRSR